MIIVKSIVDIPPLSPPLGLTLGTFDGIHLGHQHLLRELRQKVTDKGTLALITFTEHPAEVLKNRPPQPMIYNQETKMKLLEQQGVDLVILLDFSPKIFNLSFDEFIQNIRNYYPFTQLVLGKGSAFGKNRMGDELQIKQLGMQMGFEAHYIEKIKKKGELISSGYIRELLKKGDLSGAAELLGR